MDREAAHQGLPPLVLARRLIEEGLRRERHPAITFRDGPAGRRAALAGRRLDVWQVMETLRASEGDVAETAGYLQISAAQVEAAAAYYQDYPAEVDERSRQNTDEAQRQHDLWEGRQGVRRA